MTLSSNFVEKLVVDYFQDITRLMNHPEGINMDKDCSVLERKIIRQVEFYFGDKNLPRDKFLLEQISKDDNGWVPISVLTTFNRLKQLSSDEEIIAVALKKSTSDLLEVDEENKKVRRSPSKPYRAMLRKTDVELVEEKQRTVNVKGFPLDETLDNLEEFFDKIAPVTYIYMKRAPSTKEFKGSIFVEFKTKSEAVKFMELEEVKYGDVVLQREWKEEYVERKKLEKKGKSQNADVEEDTLQYTKGCVLKFVGCGQDTSIESLKELFRSFSNVAFVEFKRGDTEGYVRFEEENGAQVALDGLKEAAGEEGKMTVCGGESTVSVLEGEEEKEYHKKIFERGAARKGGRKSGGRGRGRGRGRGGYKGSKGSSHKEEGDGPPPSKQAKESTEE